MLIAKDDGTYTAGPLDVLCILYNTNAGTFHAAFFEEKPFSGSPAPHPNFPNFSRLNKGKNEGFVRLESKMHHTEGSPDLKVARGHLAELSAKIEVPPKNIWTKPRTWDGNLGIVWMFPDWRNE